MLVNTIKPIATKVLLAGGLLAGLSLFAMSAPASADTRSTAAIVAAAGLIIGAVTYDQYGRPYYMRDNRRWYVNADAARYYNDHRYDRGWDRQSNRGWGRNTDQGWGQSDRRGHRRPPERL